jgi:hypothetical protein
MQDTLTRAAVTGMVLVATGLPGRVTAQPSSNLADYALFAETKLKTKGLTLACGDIGINRERGKLIARKFLTTPGTVASDIVKVGDGFAAGTLFANILVGKFQPAATPWTPPIIGDLAGACGFPNPFPACDPGNRVLVLAGTTTALPPGVYGDVTVKGGYDEFGEPLPGVLELGGGSYTFCGVKLARFADVRFTDPATVNVATNLRMQANNVWGPAEGSGVTADQIAVYVAGSKVHYSRNAEVVARLCAPSAKCRLTNAGSHAGAVYCRFIRTEQITFVCSPGGSPSGAFVE